MRYTAAILATGDLLFLDFVEGFTVDAKISCRSCFESTHADVDATLVAKTVVIFLDTNQRFIYLFDQLSLAIAGSQFETKFFFLRCAIGWVGKVRRLVLHMVDGSIYLFHQLVTPCAQDSFKVLALGFIHVLFTRLFEVGSESMEAGSAFGVGRHFIRRRSCF